MVSPVHGTCVEIAGTGVLLRGPSGSGKSDLALRLIDRGARLVADDRVSLHNADGALTASPPPTLAGLIEARGLGILRQEHIARSRLGLVVDLVGAETIERLPAPATCRILDVELPLLRLDPFAASACVKLRLAVDMVTRDILAGP